MTKLPPRAPGSSPYESVRSAARAIVTALSHLVSHAQRRSRRKSRLAWASLSCFSAMPFLSGCIVADPPQYEDPGRTPPILNLALATPRILEPFVLDRSDPSTKETMTVELPVRSEDQGKDLIVAMHVDYTYPGSRWLTGGNVPAGTLSDMSRKITLFVPLGSVQGCHQLTLLVAHEDNWNYTVNEPDLDAQYDTALATWWVNALPATGGDANTLANCPSRSEVQKGTL